MSVNLSSRVKKGYQRFKLIVGWFFVISMLSIPLTAIGWVLSFNTWRLFLVAVIINITIAVMSVVFALGYEKLLEELDE